MTRVRLVALLVAVAVVAGMSAAWSTPFPGKGSVKYSGEPDPVAQGSHWTINHISSALHIANRTHHSAIAVRCVNTAGTAFESCGGGGSSSSSAVDTIAHISSVTHIAGQVSVTGTVKLVTPSGFDVSATGTALDVNCTGCSAASVVNVGHISSVVHIAGTVACSNCTGGPGGSSDAVNVFHQSTIRHISSLTHVVVVDWQRWAHVASAQSGAWSVTAHQGGTWNIAHIGSAVHIAGIVSVTCSNCSGSAGDNTNVFHQSTVRHISSLTHVVIVDWQRWAHVASAQSGTWSMTAHQGGAWVTNVGHVSAIQHVVIVDWQRWAHVASAQSGVWFVTAHQGGTWSVTCSPCDSVNVFHQSTVRHVSSLTHVVIVDWQRWAHVASAQSGTWSVTAHQGGSWVTNVGHIASALHIAGTINGAAFHVQGLGLPGQAHGGVLSVQGVAGGVALSVSCANCSGGSGDAVNVFHQSTVRHVSSLTHVVIVDWQRWAHVASAQSGVWFVTAHQGGTWTVAATQSGEWNVRHIGTMVHAVIVDLPRWAHMAVAQSGTWNVTAHQGGTWNLGHISGAVHIAGALNGAQIHIQGVGRPGAAHGGVMTIQGTTGMVPLEVNCTGCSAASAVNVVHISSRVHVTGHMFLTNYVGAPLRIWHGNSLSTTMQNSAGQEIDWTAATSHISSQVHLAVAQKPGSGHLLVEVVGQHQSGAIHVSGISNIGSGNAGTGTTSMACHSTLAIHVGGSASMAFTLVHLTSSNGGLNQANWRIYICSLVLYSNSNIANNTAIVLPAAQPNRTHFQATFSLVEGSGTDCATSTRGVVGWAQTTPGTTTARGGSIPLFNHSNSVVWISPFPWIATQVVGNSLCIQHNMTNTASYLTGTMSYRASQ